MEHSDINIMIIDDEEAILFTLEDALEGAYSLTLFNDSSSAIAELKQNPIYDIIISDYRLPAFTGLDILAEAKKHLNSYRAILLTAYSSKELLEQLINNKLVYTVLNKPLDEYGIQCCVRDALDDLVAEREKNEQLNSLKQIVSGIRLGNAQLVFRGKRMEELVAFTKKCARSSAPVLVSGESGVGKELIAHLIHQESSRNASPMINLNCGAIPEHLFESEMFGHKKGAFTGATSDKVGKFQLANGGTLFLDEISELPALQQTKLLRAIANKEIYPVGATTPIKVDVRIICATNKDLKELVNERAFRQDLLFRINVLDICVPPLRERKEEIFNLASYFLLKIANEDGCATKTLTDDALVYLKSLPFRENNVRELRNLIHRLLITVDHSEITVDDIRLLYEKQNTYTYDSAIFDITMPFNEFRKKVESKYLMRQLEIHNNHVTNTARAINMHTSNLSRKLKEYSLQ